MSAVQSKVDAAKATLAPKVDPNAPTGLALYSRFAFAGAVCCSVTHGALTPVDVYVFSLVELLAAANGSSNWMRCRSRL